MLKLNKKTEYALLALGHLNASEAAAPVSVRSVAGRHGIPEALLAKVLQILKRGGVVASVKGAGGGYRLSRPIAEISLTDVFNLFNEPMALVECLDDNDGCAQAVDCNLRGPMTALNAAIQSMLAGMSVAELFETPGIEPVTNLSIYRD